MDQLLKPYGLSTSDIEIVDMPSPSRLEALQTGAVDIAFMSDPWINRALETGKAVVWQTFEENLPNSQLAVVMFGPTIIKEKPEAGDRFMVAYLKAVRQYNEGKTAKNISLMAEFTKSTPEEAENYCWQSFTDDGHVNLNFILEYQKWAFNKGYLDREMELSEFWEGRYLQYALEHLP